MRAWLLTTLLLAALPATAAEKPALVDPAKMRPATELVRLLRVDELYRTIYLDGFRDMQKEGRLTAAQLQCFEAWKLEEFTRRVAEVFARDMLIEEIESAVDFYSSPTGAKLLHMAYQFNWERRPKEFPLKIEGPKQSLNYDELAEVARFRHSVGGMRLGFPLAHLDKPPALFDIGAIFLEMRIACEIGDDK